MLSRGKRPLSCLQALSVVFRSVRDTVAKFDFRRDVLLFLSTNGGQNSPTEKGKHPILSSLSPLFELATVSVRTQGPITFLPVSPMSYFQRISVLGLVGGPTIASERRAKGSTRRGRVGPVVAHGDAHKVPGRKGGAGCGRGRDMGRAPNASRLRPHPRTGGRTLSYTLQSSSR